MLVEMAVMLLATDGLGIQCRCMETLMWLLRLTAVIEQAGQAVQSLSQLPNIAQLTQEVAPQVAPQPTKH